MIGGTMRKLNWEIVHECDDEQGNPTQWAADVTDSKGRRFFWIDIYSIE